MYFQLLYISSASRPMLRIDIESILFSARRANDKSGITGLLITSPTRFMQVLEGDEAQVREIYERIAEDPRHRAHVILRETKIAERQFGQWNMASQFLNDDDLIATIDIVREAVGDCDIITKAYLMGFAEQRYAA
jgi:hypothetical protein